MKSSIFLRKYGSFVHELGMLWNLDILANKKFSFVCPRGFFVFMENQFGESLVVPSNHYAVEHIGSHPAYLLIKLNSSIDLLLIKGSLGSLQKILVRVTAPCQRFTLRRE